MNKLQASDMTKKNRRDNRRLFEGNRGLFAFSIRIPSNCVHFEYGLSEVYCYGVVSDSSKDM